MNVRQFTLRIDIAHEGDVEDLAQVPERLAGAYLAAGVRRIDEGLGEEKHLKARTWRPLARAHDPERSPPVSSIARDDLLGTFFWECAREGQLPNGSESEIFELEEGVASGRERP